MTAHTTRTTCRGCGGQLDNILGLGDLYLSTFLAKDDPLPPQVPLRLCACRTCELVQLQHTTHADRLYRRYWYRSGINETMVAELQDIVCAARAHVGGLMFGDAVIDIGANDGTLLAAYKTDRAHMPVRIAFEPAYNLYDALRPHAEVLVADYFPAQLQQIRAKIITSIAMVYDLDDPHTFIQAVADRLATQGVWVVQFQDLVSMLEATAYDNICHEHVCYYSLRSFEHLLGPHGLQIVDGELRTINGGSLRLFVQHRTRGEGSARLQGLRDLERNLDWDRLVRFAWQVREHREQLRALLTRLRDMGQIVDLYGASTKANTLLQYCDINRVLVRCAVERSPDKFGLRTVGTDIPIVSEAVWRQGRPPDAALLTIWQFRNHVLAREAAYLQQGGSFIVPLPQLEIVKEGP